MYQRVEIMLLRVVPLSSLDVVGMAKEVQAGGPIPKEIGADLIAMTTHGRSGLGRILFGSVAEAVLRGSPIPVFLMKMTDAVEARRVS